MTDVRIKLHATLNNDDVQNIWMSLSYDKKPTIGHILNQLKQNFNCDDDTLINLYLDEFWLPPWENSRLLRENDYIKVEINSKTEKVSKSSFVKSASTSNIESTNYYEPIKQKLENETKLKEKSNLKTANDLKNLNQQQQPQQLKQQQQEQQQIKQQQNKDVNKFVLNKLSKSSSSSSSSNSSTSSQSSSPVVTKKNENKQTNNKNASKPTAKNQATKATNDLNKNTKPVNFATHKKFSVANYIHLLNEDKNENDEEHWFQNEQEKAPVAKSNKKLTASFNNDIDKISQTISATAKTKWKNSSSFDKLTQQQQQSNKTMPQHIRFESSTSSDDDSSDSDSSSESTTSTETNQRNKKQATNTTQPAKKVNNAPVPEANKNKKSPQKQEKNQNSWKPLSKEEQINMISYNRSYVVKNNKPSNEFKNNFNKTKVNAPVNGNEEYYYYEDDQPLKKDSKKVNIDFEKLELLIGIPKLNDQIAFQILEISSNFTPEISEYKTGTVVSYDDKANEVTLKLDGSSYNEVLKKPNKFTVIEDEENEYYEDENGEMRVNREKSEIKNNEEVEEEDILIIDWSSLINVKKMQKNVDIMQTTETEQPALQQQQQQESTIVEQIQVQVDSKPDSIEDKVQETTKESTNQNETENIDTTGNTQN